MLLHNQRVVGRSSSNNFDFDHTQHVSHTRFFLCGFYDIQVCLQSFEDGLIEACLKRKTSNGNKMTSSVDADVNGAYLINIFSEFLISKDL